MRVRVNGKELNVEAGTALDGLLAILSMGTKGIAVELNGEVVPRARHAETALNEGDSIEIIRMVGGG
jgi:sulfur carrier protein